jgi:hypothetical protein
MVAIVLKVHVFKGSGTMKTVKRGLIIGLYMQGLSIIGWTEKIASHEVGVGCEVQ